MISVPKDQFESLIEKCRKLQIENQQLIAKMKVLNEGVIIPQINDCQENLNQTIGFENLKIQSPNPIRVDEIKKEWSEWSKKLGNFKKLEASSREDDRVEIYFQEEEQQETSWENTNKTNQNQIHLIEDICLFGPKEKEIVGSIHRAFYVGTQLLYPDKPKYQAYGSYMFPEDIQVKQIREEKYQNQANRVIFKKNTKKQDNTVYVFQGQQNHPIFTESNQTNKLIQHVNPSSKLYLFALHFSDFITILQQQSCLSDMTFSQANLQGNSPALHRNLSLTESYDKEKWKLYTGRYCICILTYFPFVGLFQKILVSIIDQIKIKRMSIYNNQPENLTSIDIRYFKYELNLICCKIKAQLTSISPILGNNADLQLSQAQPYHLDLSLSNLPILMYENWVSPCLKIFTKETFFEILCYMLMEESLCFVSQDIHLLTHIVLLFNDLILRPFSSPHPCISLMFREELLGTPFIITMGINKNTKWLDQNSELFSESKVIINMNEQIQIRSKRKVKVPKCQKLRKIVNEYYRKNETSSLPLFFKRKDSSTKIIEDQNDSLYALINNLHTFFQEEVINHLPPDPVIEQFKSSIPSDCSQKHKTLIDAIDKHFIESRKRDKDPFIQQLAQQQLFYAFICSKYQLK